MQGKKSLRIVGIDYGEVRIGLAISDERGKIALPLKTIQAGKNHAATIVLIQEALRSYAEQIQKIVIGLPLHMNGKESPMSEKVRFFGAKLKEALHFEVVFFDERLTSSYMEKELKEMDYSRKGVKSRIDASAAAVLLQNYLDISS